MPKLGHNSDESLASQHAALERVPQPSLSLLFLAILEVKIMKSDRLTVKIDEPGQSEKLLQ